MTIPSYQSLMLPLLRVLGEAGKDTELHKKDYTARVADALGLTPEQRSVTLPSGGQKSIDNRVSWACWYMQQAKLVEKGKRGCSKITDEGLKLLAKNPATIDNKLLATYPSFAEKMQKSAGDEEPEALPQPATEQTPTEQIEQAHLKLNQTLASDLRDIMAKMDPYRFEELVVDLLFAMGYGGSRVEAALVTQKSNDHGIDGIISEDRLGLDMIYVQAKRWQNTIGGEQIQSFVGALAGKHATKGVFITTSDFLASAIEYAKTVQHKIILIGGQKLAELMIEYNIGVSTVRSIAIKRVDSDYFEEE